VDHNPLVIWSKAPALALLSIPASRHLTRGQPVGATQLRLARCSAHRGGVRPAACQKPAVGVGIGLARLGCRAPVAELVTNAVKAMAARDEEAVLAEPIRCCA